MERPKTVSFYCADCDRAFDNGTDLFDHVLTKEHEKRAREQFVLVPPLEMDLDLIPPLEMDLDEE